MKKIALILIFYLQLPWLFAQPCEPKFIDLGLKNIDHAKIFKQDPSHYLIIADIQQGNTSNRDIVIRLIDTAGNEVWTKYISDTLITVITDAIELKDGNLLVLAEQKVSNSYSKSLLIKLDKLGNVLWMKDNFKGIFYKIYQEANGEILLAGQYINPQLANQNELILARMDLNDKIVFSRTYYFKLIDSSHKIMMTYYSGPNLSSLIEDPNTGDIYLGIYYPTYIATGYPCAGLIMKLNHAFDEQYIKPLNTDYGKHTNPIVMEFASTSSLNVYAELRNGGLDGCSSLFNKYEYDINKEKTIAEKGYYYKGRSFSDAKSSKDKNSVTILAQNGIFRFDDTLGLMSASLLNTNKDILKTTFSFIEDGINKFSVVLNMDGNNLFLAKFDYFGHDCKCLIKGNIFQDQNQNCLRDSGEAPVCLCGIIFGGCDYITTNSNGDYTYPGEYGYNHLYYFKINTYSATSCLNYPRETIYIPYKKDTFIHNAGVQLTKKCYSLLPYFFTNNGSIGGNHQTYINLTNAGDKDIIKIKFKIWKIGGASHFSSSSNLTLINDTLFSIIDTLRSKQNLQFNFQDSVSCDTAPGHIDLYIVEYTSIDPCLDSIIIKRDTLVFTTLLGNPKITYSKKSNFSRACGRSNISEYLTNSTANTVYNIEYIVSRDPRLILLNANPLNYSIQGNEVIFHIDSLRPYEQKIFVIADSIPCTIPEGEKLCFQSTLISYTNCLQKIENIIHDWCSIITTNKDPNLLEGHLDNGADCYGDGPIADPVNYNIRFQNTGTDTVIHVKIIDSLESGFFDYSSLNILSSSHRMIVSNYPDSHLIFEFQNINLPDSVHNKSKSIGFVNFSVALKNPIAIQSNHQDIKNKATIYFDQNPGIPTNEHIIKHCDDIHTKTNWVLPKPKNNYFIYPNPTQRLLYIGSVDNSIEGPFYISINDISGRNVLRTTLRSLIESVDIIGLQVGTYLMSIVHHNKKEMLKIIVLR